MRLTVVDREEIDNGQLAQFVAPDLEYGFTVAFTILATIKDDIWPKTVGAEFLLVIAEQFYGLFVVEGTLIVPGG